MGVELHIGIVGTGGIAIHFANACNAVEHVEVDGVFSPNPLHRESFLSKTKVRTSFSSLEELLQDRAIDLVYIATPNNTHYNIASEALNAGKHVLCEKPMCVDLCQTRELFSLAKQKGLFLMEGMWSRFLPVTQKATSWIREGALGQIRFIDAQFSFEINPPIPRLFDSKAGGGALFDVGVYAIEMASWYTGSNPSEWHGYCKPWTNGVDASSALILRFPKGELATLRMGIDCSVPEEMNIYGEKGYIRIPLFHRPNEAYLFLNSGYHENYTNPFVMPDGFVWQIKEILSCYQENRITSLIVPPEDTIAAAEIMCSTMQQFFPQN